LVRRTRLIRGAGDRLRCLPELKARRTRSRPTPPGGASQAAPAPHALPASNLTQVIPPDSLYAVWLRLPPSEFEDAGWCCLFRGGCGGSIRIAYRHGQHRCSLRTKTGRANLVSVHTSAAPLPLEMPARVPSTSVMLRAHPITASTT
jgi:hypothetical protein